MGLDAALLARARAVVRAENSIARDLDAGQICAAHPIQRAAISIYSPMSQAQPDCHLGLPYTISQAQLNTRLDVSFASIVECAAPYSISTCGPEYKEDYHGWLPRLRCAAQRFGDITLHGWSSLKVWGSGPPVI